MDMTTTTVTKVNLTATNIVGSNIPTGTEREAVPFRRYLVDGSVVTMLNGVSYRANYVDVYEGAARVQFVKQTKTGRDYRDGRGTSWTMKSISSRVGVSDDFATGMEEAVKSVTAKPEPVTTTEARIRSAYENLSASPGAWVGLAALRDALSDIPPLQIDYVLVRMERLVGISIAPEENQKTLTQRDRDAAVEIGGKKKHLIAIDD